MKSLVTLIAACTLLCLTACNTVKGMGQDIKNAGEKIENAAKK